MSKCKCLKCNVNVNSVSNRCPLCNSELKNWDKNDSYYPPKVTGIKHEFLKKMLLLIAIVCCIGVFIVNYIVTPNIKWSIFVVIQIFITCLILSKILSGKNRVLKFIFACNSLICGISIFWDFYIGVNKGWSLDYVLPSLCITYGIFALVLRIVNYFAFRENSSYIYFNVALGFVPLILLHYGFVKVEVLAYFCAAFALFNLIILLIFDWSDLKNYIAKKLHI